MRKQRRATLLIHWFLSSRIMSTTQTLETGAQKQHCDELNHQRKQCKSKRIKFNKQKDGVVSRSTAAAAAAAATIINRQQLICSCLEANNNDDFEQSKLHKHNDDERQLRANEHDRRTNAMLTPDETTAAAAGAASVAVADLEMSARTDALLPLASLNHCPVRALRFRNGIHTLGAAGPLNARQRSICNQHMPWFGIDVGGSLVKVVFFDPKEAANNEELVTLKRIRRYLKSSKPYGTTGRRDAHLEMHNCLINGRVGSLHFIRFATSEMPEFLAMAQSKRLADTVNTICATGGGACKFETTLRNKLGIRLHKTDELDSIIYGIHYIDKYNSERECYFLRDPLDDVKCVKVPYDFSRPYPYLVVNIGSGVSILAVYSSTSYSRISGSSIGGGTFLGLCCLLTQCETFDEAIRLAKAGSSTKIDKLVKDIYGGDYPKFNLSGDTVASNFGHMNLAEKRKHAKREDLARALLEMVTINIGSIARMCAVNEGIDRVVFIGNFLRVNQLSMKLLSYAVNYWSKGAIKALFLEHEGYFGAVGCFVESTNRGM